MLFMWTAYLDPTFVYVNPTNKNYLAWQSKSDSSSVIHVCSSWTFIFSLWSPRIDVYSFEAFCKYFLDKYTCIQAILFLHFESRDMLSKRCLVSLNTVLAENLMQQIIQMLEPFVWSSKQLPPTTVEKITETVN